jgi:serine/threonine protein kinase
MGLRSGARLGPYEIQSPLGAGGMGEVYRACDTRLRRIVAIKILPEHLCDSPEARLRFDREAQTLSSFSHPNICQLYDVGEQDGNRFLVMEYLDGETLADRLRKGPLPLEQGLKIGMEMCESLEKAHRRGVLHRDLKPSNIMLTKSGTKLMDFGLAKVPTPVLGSLTSSNSLATISEPLTTEGTIVGTVQYMSPEQLEGNETDARSDIFSLGAVLYEMITGKRAFEGKTTASTIAAILAAEPKPILILRPLSPRRLEQVVRGCLAKNPDDRWQSAHDLKTNLEWIAEDEGPVMSSAPKHNSWPERALWILAAVFMSIFTYFAAGHRGIPINSSVSARFSINPPENAVFSGAPNITVQVPQFALSPDGRTFVFIASSAGAEPMLWLRSIDQVDARPLLGTEQAELPFWSPDNHWVGFFAEGKLKKIPVGGGPAQVLAEVADPFGGSWGADDNIVFAKLSSTIFRTSSAGGVVTSVTKLNPSHQEAAHRWPQFLPDGRHFIFNVQGTLAEYRGIYVGSVDGESEKFLVHSETAGVYAWPGYLLYLDGDTLLARAFDPAHLEVKGEPLTIASHIGRSAAFNVAVSASDTGTLAHAAAILQHERLTWFDRAGNSLGVVGTTGDYPDFRLSPKDETLALSLVDPRSWNPDIWLIDLSRSSLSRFTVGTALNASPLWAPDGSRILFRTNRNGATELYGKSAGGGGNEDAELTQAAQLAAGIESPNLVPSDWSPDGRYLIGTIPQKTTGYDLWLIPLGGNKKPVKFLESPGDQLHANFSPEGHFVAYSSDESGRFQVYVQTIPLSDRKWQVSTNGGYEPRWKADGREIYYLSDDRKLMAVTVSAGPAFGVPKVLFQTRVPQGVISRRTHYVPTRDGSRFLISTQTDEAPSNPITIVLNWQAELGR